MADKSRVPVTISPFNDYVNLTDNFLQALDPDSGLQNWQRLSLSAIQAADWHTKRLKWDNLWAVYINKTKCTSITRQDVRDFMKSFRKFAMPLLNIMAASSAAAPKDELTFRFKTHRSKPTRHEIKIAEHCIPSIEVRGHGVFNFRCRADQQEGRGRKPATADSVQLAYRIYDMNETVGPESLDVDNPAFLKEIFTTSKFVFEAGAQHSRKWIVFYTRWFNTRRRFRAGDWSEMQKLVIA